MDILDTRIVGGCYGGGLALDLIKSNIDVSDDTLLKKRKKDFIAFVNDISKETSGVSGYSYSNFFFEAFNLFFKTDKVNKETK